jgi:hypothetical protein
MHKFKGLLVLAIKPITEENSCISYVLVFHSTKVDKKIIRSFIFYYDILPFNYLCYNSQHKKQCGDIFNKTIDVGICLTCLT